MADPFFGLGLLVVGATVYRDRQKCIVKGHDMHEVTSGMVHGCQWTKAAHDPGTLVRCRRCGHQVFSIG